MRISTVFILLSLVCVGPARPAELLECPTNYHEVSYEHPDARIRTIFVQLLDQIGADKHKYALCESPSLLGPRTLIQLDPDMYVVRLPPHVSGYSDQEILGSLAHEAAHVQYRGAAKSVDLEVAVDLLAARWVGKDAVIEGLHAMIREKNRYPAFTRQHLVDQMTLRINLLQRQKMSAQNEAGIE